MSLARVVAWNTVVQAGGRLVGLVASVALTALLTRYLGLATYGKLVAAITYIGLFGVLAESGLYLAVVRRAAQEPERRAAILGTALGLRLMFAAVPLVLAVVVAQFIPTARFPTYDSVVKLVVILAAANAYVTLLNQFLIAVFRLHLRMDLLVLGETAQRIVTLGGVLLVMASKGGLMLLTGAILAGSLANLAFGWIVGSRFETLVPRFERKLARELLGESAVLWVISILALIHFKVDTLLLSLLKPAQDVGIYGVAYNVHEVILGFPGLFVGLLYPVYSRLVTEDRERLRQVFQRSFDVLLLTSVGTTLLVCVLSIPMAELLGAAQAATAMRILAFSMPGVFLGMGFTHLLLAEGRQRWLVGLYAVLVLANVGANLLFIRWYSYLGAAGVTVGTETLALVCLLFYWVRQRQRRVELRCLWGVPLGLLLGALLTAAAARWMPGAKATLAVRLVGLGIGGITCLGLYVAGLVGLRILPLGTLRALRPGGGPTGAAPRAPQP